MAAIFDCIVDGQHRLRDRGYNADVMFAGQGFQQDLFDEINTFQNGIAGGELKIAGMDLEHSFWLDFDEAMLVDSHGRPDAMIIGPDTPHYYTDAVERIQPQKP